MRGPYAEFNASVAKSTRDVYEGPLSRLGGDADDVARAIEKALAKSRAPTRVPVTASARFFMGLRRVLPTAPGTGSSARPLDKGDSPL